jgi:hypothetical protein
LQATDFYVTIPRRGDAGKVKDSVMKKQTEKPNIILALVICVDYDFPNALYTLTIINKKTSEPMAPIYIGEGAMPTGLDKGKIITIWLSKNLTPKHIAYGDRIVHVNTNEKSVLNDLTQKHFDDYQQELNMRLGMKENLAEIERKIAVIKSINTEFEKSAKDTQNTLINFLNGQAEKLRDGLKSHGASVRNRS